MIANLCSGLRGLCAAANGVYFGEPWTSPFHSEGPLYADGLGGGFRSNSSWSRFTACFLSITLRSSFPMPLSSVSLPVRIPHVHRSRGFNGGFLISAHTQRGISHTPAFFHFLCWRFGPRFFGLAFTRFTSPSSASSLA